MSGSRLVHSISLLAIALSATACSPFNDATLATCALSNTVYDSTIDVGPNQSNWTNIGQAIVPTSPIRANSILLALSSNVPSGTTLNGTLTLSVALDGVTTSGNTTPTSPSSVIATASLAASSVATAGTLYSFSFTPGVAVNAQQVYWLVLSSTTPAGSPYFVQWLGSDVGAYSAGIGEVLTNGFGWQQLSGATPGGTAINGAGVDFAFEMGCPT